MNIRRIYLFVVVTALVLFTGCGNKETINTITNTDIYNDSVFNEEIQSIESSIDEKILQEDNDVEVKEYKIKEDSKTVTTNQEKYDVKVISNTKSILPLVENNDYSKAYAQALSEGARVPTEEARMLMDKYNSLIENEPRLVIDTNSKLHIIWTNKDMFLVIDGSDTDTKVSECIFADVLPRLPDNLNELEKYHAVNENFTNSIAVTSFLEDLNSEQDVEYLYKVRFYNYNGKAVAVYSLTENGELYIDGYKAEEVLAK